ncbi:MAG TPA: DUF2946 family protein [Ramlibacter sp.]|nr:DUF2946 family protein [Ramlibacter sp.]
MQALRQSAFLARLVLAWFALSIGLATAAPLMDPQGVQLVCSGSGGTKLVVKGGEMGGSPTAGHPYDCPFCVLVAPPPAVAPVACAGACAQAPLPLSRTQRHGVLRESLPPARGPPAPLPTA